jgi:hypothetical protein
MTTVRAASLGPSRTGSTRQRSACRSRGPRLPGWRRAPLQIRGTRRELHDAPVGHSSEDQTGPERRAIRRSRRRVGLREAPPAAQAAQEHRDDDPEDDEGADRGHNEVRGVRVSGHRCWLSTHDFGPGHQVIDQHRQHSFPHPATSSAAGRGARMRVTWLRGRGFDSRLDAGVGA